MVEKKGKKWTRWFGLIISILLLSLVFGQVGEVKLVEAVAGSYSINFKAGDTDAYIPDIPYPGPGAPPNVNPGVANTAPPLFGRIYGDDYVDNTDFKGDPSLEPSDMHYCQIVPYFFYIEVDGSTDPEGGSIILKATWGTQTTSGSEFGFDKYYKVYAAFVDTSDLSTIEVISGTPETDATVTSVTDYWIDSKGNVVTSEGTDVAFEAEFQIDGLDDGDAVVVEVWTVLGCVAPPGGITGNIHVALEEAYTNPDPPDNPATISTGNQTNPIVQAGDLTPAPVDLQVIKYDDNIPKAYIYPETAQWMNTIDVFGETEGDDTILYVANDVVVTDTLDNYVQVIDDEPYEAGTHPFGYVISPQILIPVGDPIVYEPYRTCDITTGPGGTLTCYLEAIAEGTTVTIEYWVKAVQVDDIIPVDATCEGDTDQNDPELNSATDVDTECPDGYDVMNLVDVITVSDDTNPNNDWDEEPKDITQPTPVDLIAFKATPEEDQVILTWETASEFDTFGFDLLRADSPNDKWEVIATILSKSPGGNSGASYEYRDVNVTYRVPYVYWLQEITLDGRQSDIFGPAIVTYPNPFSKLKCLLWSSKSQVFGPE